MTPAERAAELETSQVLAEAHKEGAMGGQTAAPEADADVLHHYVAFVNVDGDLYELDGTNEAPINLGPSTDFLKDAAREIKKRISFFEDESLEFSVLSLGPNPSMD
ncbi:ubiquitinyl hydrolase 1, partial [Coemansia asiatica]